MGGTEIQILNLVRNINKNLFEIYLGLLYQNDELKKEFSDLTNVHIINFNKTSKLDFFVYYRIAKFLKKNKIDIINTFLSNHHAYIPCFFYRKSKSIGGIRSTYTNDKSLISTMLRFNLLHLSTKINNMHIISNSYAGKELYVNRKIPEEKITVIPNGIDYYRFYKGDRNKIIKEFKLKGKLVLGMVSRIDKRKNHEELIECFSHLEKKYKNLTLIIVGTGPHLNNLKLLVSQKSLNSKIIFTGLRKDIPDILHALDIFVFPSKFPEGWPNAIGEAMSAKLPVLSYPCGDASKIINNGYNGFVTEPNIESFEQQLEQLIKNKSLRHKLGANAKKTIFNNFTISHMIKKYEQIYTQTTKR